MTGVPNPLGEVIEVIVRTYRLDSEQFRSAPRTCWLLCGTCDRPAWVRRLLVVAPRVPSARYPSRWSLSFLSPGTPGRFSVCICAGRKKQESHWAWQRQRLSYLMPHAG